jgi:hypothetical protein
MKGFTPLRGAEEEEVVGSEKRCWIAQRHCPVKRCYENERVL